MLNLPGQTEAIALTNEIEKKHMVRAIDYLEAEHGAGKTSCFRHLLIFALAPQPRPLTHDLMKSTLENLGYRVRPCLPLVPRQCICVSSRLLSPCFGRI